MNRIYLAASFGRQAEMRQRRIDLADRGFLCCSRWLDAKSDDDGLFSQPSSHELAKAAMDDIEDIFRADYFCLFSEAQDSLLRRGGRLVEFGIALACLPMPRIHVVGRRETIFHQAEGVKVHKTFGACLDVLTQQLKSDLRRRAS